MHKLLMALLIVSMTACSTVQAKAVDRTNSEDLIEFCGTKQVLIEKLFYDAANANGTIRRMIFKDTKDFTPLLFAQCKMENLSILSFAVYAEIGHTIELGRVSDLTIDMLGKYLYFIKQDITKAKLFEGMIADAESTEYVVLAVTSAHLISAYDLLTDIKNGLEKF